MPNRARKDATAAVVVDLAAARDRQRLERSRCRVIELLEMHRSALTTLFESGLVFTRYGTRIGRELLNAQQALLRASDLMAREVRERAPARAAAEALLDDVETLLERTAAKARRHMDLLGDKG